MKKRGLLGLSLTPSIVHLERLRSDLLTVYYVSPISLVQPCVGDSITPPDHPRGPPNPVLPAAHPTQTPIHKKTSSSTPSPLFRRATTTSTKHKYASSYCPFALHFFPFYRTTHSDHCAAESCRPQLKGESSESSSCDYFFFFTRQLPITLVVARLLACQNKIKS